MGLSCRLSCWSLLILPLLLHASMIGAVCSAPAEGRRDWDAAVPCAQQVGAREGVITGSLQSAGSRSSTAASRLQGRTLGSGDAGGRLRAAYEISSLPGQPVPVNFKQYSGYLTVEGQKGRTLFFYYVQAPGGEAAAKKKPLVLWLNGGPGCSSVGYQFEENGPFRVKCDGRTLSINEYSWNKEANMLYLELPIGTGFSYSNTSSDYDNIGDESAVDDSYVFLLELLEIFPELIGRPFFITGESYAGHYVPQLAEQILLLNSHYKRTIINLQGIMVGNPYLDKFLNEKGRADYYRSHGIMSEEVFKNITRNCYSDKLNVVACNGAWDEFYPAVDQIIDIYNIYAPICINKPDGAGYYPSSPFHDFDPCSDKYTVRYMNDPDVQSALHARRMTNWSLCVELTRKDEAISMVPTIKRLISEGLPVWLYSGDFDSVCPIQATQYSINELGLKVTTPLRPWIVNKEVAGYIQQYEGGFTFATVRGAGHDVPSYQPERALGLFKSFLKGELPPNKEA